ncbi:MAG: glycosyltransferase family 2 protein [Ruminococcus sp.]
MNPKVSIIVPVYKTKDTVKECVDSLLCQTLKNIEIILVDDGSPDESGKICDEFCSDKRVKVIHKENGGLSSARNAGLKAATGEYIGFVDSDDYVHPEMFERLYNRIISDKSDICICSHYTVDNAGNNNEHFFINIPELLDKEMILNYLILPLIGANKERNESEIEGFVWRNLYRRELIKEYEFKSEGEYFAEDIVSDLELYIKCKQISILNECLYYYRYNGESLSNCYRPRVYVLLNNLLKWEEEYLNKHNLLTKEKERLNTTGVKFTLFSIQNVKKGELENKIEIEEAKKILNQDMLKKSVHNVKLSIYNLKMKAFILLCRIKCVRLLIRLL